SILNRTLVIGFDLGASRLGGVTAPAGTYSDPGISTLTGGYNFNDTWAGELSYTNFGDSVLSIAKIKLTSLRLVAVGKYPINDKVDLFGKAGLAHNTAQISILWATSPEVSGDTATIGFGGQYHLTPQVNLRAQYDYLGKFATWTSTGVDITASIISLGATYTF
ncbi:MAG: outer membrane beta-barrel protein, partial [Gallionellaceae bacterium]|nr:outer membrane beta-barrel protein [Gallionellaceae bacterium]